MNRRFILHLRSIYSRIFKLKIISPPPREMNKDVIQKIIYDKILSGDPFMFARVGRLEGDMCENIKYTFYEKRNNLQFILWRGQPNFLNPFLIPLFGMNAGFFPTDNVEALKQYYHLMLKCMKEVDILASCCDNEYCFQEELKKSIKVDHELSTPLLTPKPWTLALEGKRVLVVHPFAESIREQYLHIDKIFPEEKILPSFHLETLKAIQTSGGGTTSYKDWFEVLKYMESEIDKRNYDVCILGCGAYGFPLAAHCKQMGKQALQLGGITQLLFGIKGQRWETGDKYLNQFPYSKTYYNQYWIRPSESERPKNADKVEQACYW